MIRIYNYNNLKNHPVEISEIFKLRKKVFHDLLKWDVKLEGDWEIDEYDKANPVYVASYDDTTKKLRGALRLLPTLGLNMLNDTFPQLIGAKKEIRSASVWESSRFCIDPEISQNRAVNQVTIAAAELMCGVGELSIESQISDIVTVTDVFLERMFRRMGCPGNRLGAPQKIGSVKAVALAWEIDENLLTTMKSVASLKSNILEIPMTLHAARNVA